MLPKEKSPASVRENTVSQVNDNDDQFEKIALQIAFQPTVIV